MKLHMRHRILLVLLICLFTVSSLCACSQQPDTPKGPQDVLAFPGTSWDMTPDALIKSLKLKAGTYGRKVPIDAERMPLVWRTIPCLGKNAG